MPLLLAVYKAPNGANGFRHIVTLPVTFFKYWEERGFEIKRVEFIETPEGEIVLKPIKTPIQHVASVNVNTTVLDPAVNS